MRMSQPNQNRSGGITLSCLSAAAVVALGLATTAQAEDYDLYGAKVEWAASDIQDNVKGKTAVTTVFLCE